MILFVYNFNLISAQSNALSNIDSFNPKNISAKSNFKLSSEMQNQISLYEYLYISDIDPISTTNDQIEPLYNAKLFYNQSNMVIINHISQSVDGSKYEISHQYVYDNTGKILKILCLEDPRYKIEFFYKNGLLTNMKKYRPSVPMTVTEGHKVTHTQSENMLDEIIFTYNNGLLVQQNFSTSPQTYALRGARSYYYYQDNNNSALIYVKYTDKSSLNEERLICFDNNRIKYITYSYKTSFNDNTIKIQQILLFTYNGNNIEIKHYESNRSKSGIMTLSRNYEIQIGENSIIENIKTNYILTLSPHTKETYFQYHYSQNRLIGYEIFKRTIYNKEKTTEKDYELSKAFYLVLK